MSTITTVASFPNAVGASMSIRGVLEAQAARYPTAVAIGAPGCASLTYGELHRHVSSVVDRLNSLGIGRTDCVAVALPNGPEMATAFLAIAAGAVCAPLNPNYTAAEFDFYLSDLAARAIVVPTGSDSPVIAVAKARGIAVLEISPRPAGAGLFDIVGQIDAMPARPGFGEAHDTALVLHTSGTTSRPKMIPLSHANLCTSAESIRASLELAEHDRCLNVMPLFHIHGLVGALLSSLTAGAAVICTRGFSAVNFFQWVDEFRPTWYTAVPTMHQEVLARVAANREIVERHRFRFIRSCSAALPPRMMAELERAFETPVIEAYGMTEAAHQIASNPLPPGQRKPGSVGVPAGPEVGILDQADHLLPSGESGEIAIRGANVSARALPKPASGSPSGGGWFRTGDTGYLDEDGFLFLSGRVKEIINRGGEKISPREVDEVMLEHPGVAQVVTCAVPDAKLGEAVLAVVVRRPDVPLTERELREFVFDRLAPFKVPSRVIFVDQIPKGPTGKIQRIGLAKRLGIESVGPRPSDADSSVAPTTPIETTLADIWKEMLQVEKIGIDDNFFELGGDSLAAVEVVLRAEQRLGVTLDARQLAFGTLRQLAAACEEAAGRADATPLIDRAESSHGGQNGVSTTTHWRAIRREVLRTATQPLANHWPIERYPGWLGKIHNVRVPRNVQPNTRKGPGGGANIRIVFRALEPTLSLDGDIAECGVFQGSTLIPIALFAQRRGSSKQVLGFDSFEGLDQSVEVDMTLSGDEEERKRVGGFSDTSYEHLVRRVRQFGLESRVGLAKGYFRDTLGRYANRRFSFVHLDCVIYESYKQSLEFFYPRLVKGGVILMDEYRDPPWPGCTQAVDEFLADKPEKPLDIESDNHVRYYLRKL